jgi:hypothetical protein
MPGVSSAFVFGDVVRVTAAEGGPGVEDLGHVAERACGGHVRVTSMRVDMEAAFAFLVGEARLARPGGIAADEVAEPTSDMIDEAAGPMSDTIDGVAAPDEPDQAVE